MSTVENWWEGFLSLWRALLLGNRIRDPAALRALLVMLPPVDLTWVDVARLLHWENLYGFPSREHYDVPEDWTLGPPLHDEDSNDVLEAANTLVILELLEERKDFKGQYEVLRDNRNSRPHLSYQVCDEDGKPTEIARFMEGKLKLWKQGEPLSQAQYDKLALHALGNNIAYRISDANYYGSEWDEETDALLVDIDFDALPKDWPDIAARHFFGTPHVIMDCECGPYVEDFDALVRFLHALKKGRVTKRGQVKAADLTIAA